MLIASTKPAVQYTAVFVAAAGAFPNASMCMAWCGECHLGVFLYSTLVLTEAVCFGQEITLEVIS